MAVFDALRILGMHIKEAHPENHLADLYELVQYAGNILPRLYLMITVGTVYMSIPDAPVKEIMKDMMEMSRGIQHPTRGLFLRYYLSGQARDCLPAGSGDGPEGNLQDSINFILTNFVEMNKLWVRLQHQGHSREREQRTRERQELQLLVGNNLVRLSQLVDLDSYKATILGPLLEQVVQCRDVLAQEYLLEVITQVFPDEYHLNTLDQLLSAISRLNMHVNIKAIVIGLMNRLSSYAQDEPSQQSTEDRKQKEEEAVVALLEKVRISQEAQARAKTDPIKQPNGEGQQSSDAGKSSSDTKESSKEPPTNNITKEPNSNGAISKVTATNAGLFEIFYDQVSRLIPAQRLPIQDAIALLGSLANLALNIYPERLEYLDKVLSFALERVQQHANSPDLHSKDAQLAILSLLLAPVHRYVSLFTALSLPSFLPLLRAQTYPTQRSVAQEIAQNLLRNHTTISTTSQLDAVFEVLRVLIKEGMSPPAGYPTSQIQRQKAESEETIEEQGWLARIVHLLQGEDNDAQFRLLQAARNYLDEGNQRVRYTTPPLITLSIALARKYKQREHYEDNWQSQSSSLYKFMHTAISTLHTRVNGAADLCLRLFVACGQIADQTGFEEVAYEFFAQAFTVYEEFISDSRAQYQAVCVFASALQQTRNFTKENYDTLITKCALHSSKLLKKPDQCRAVYIASHLWWPTEIRARGEENPDQVWQSTSSKTVTRLTLDSYTATASESSNASNEPSAWQIPAWTRQFQQNSSSKS